MTLDDIAAALTEAKWGLALTSSPLYTILAGLTCILLTTFYTLSVETRLHQILARHWSTLQCTVVSPRTSSQTETPKRTVNPEPPCAAVVLEAQAANIRHGHENDGFLSYQAGFLPLHEPLLAFPARYAAWDDLVRHMPALISSQKLQAAIEALPVLPADQASLPDKYLHRATTFFCIVAHAYIRLDGDAPLELVGAGGERRVHKVPAALEEPWKAVSSRLGREQPFMSYVDLIVYNWKWKEDIPRHERHTWELEKLALLVPTVDNQEENVFYLTQLELLSKASPLIRNIVDAQRAVLRQDSDALKSVLREVIITLDRIGKETLWKVSSRPSSKSYTSPVVWTKSVASLAIPLRSDVTGPTGTGSPFFHMMDEFIERSRHDGHLGQEYLRLRAGYPKHWKLFLEAINSVSVKQFVAASADAELKTLWDNVSQKYCGQFGILGLHRRKVFAYLSTAFRIGRTTTIGGFKGKPSEEPWMKVHRELEVARQERCSNKDDQHGDPAHEMSLAASPHSSSPLRRIPVSELLSHTTRSSRYWFSARGLVYDATSYASSHPGGEQIIVVSSGRDISSDLHFVQHFSDASISARMARFVIGSVAVCNFPKSALLQELYDFTVALGYRIAEQQGTWKLDMSFLDRKLTRVDPDDHLTMQKARYFDRAWTSLRSVYAPSLAAHMHAMLTTLLAIIQQSLASTDVHCIKITDLLQRLDCIMAGIFPAPMADCTMGTLNMAQVRERAASNLESLSRARIKVISLLQALEGIRGQGGDEILHMSFCEKAAEFVSELERLGSLD